MPELSPYEENAPAQILQILMYYLVGLRSVHEEFQQVKWLALLNPSKNLVKFVNVNQIAAPVIEKVNKKVIGY